jgi:hypothetical protein
VPISDEWIKKMWCIHIIEYYSATKKNEPGTVIHVCNPSYLGGRSRKIMSLRLAWAKVVRS